MFTSTEIIQIGFYNFGKTFKLLSLNSKSKSTRSRRPAINIVLVFLDWRQNDFSFASITMRDENSSSEPLKTSQVRKIHWGICVVGFNRIYLKRSFGCIGLLEWILQCRNWHIKRKCLIERAPRLMQVSGTENHVWGRFIRKLRDR